MIVGGLLSKFGMVCVGLTLGSAAMSVVQASLPVVVFMRATDWQVSATHVSAVVHGYKLGCTLIAGSEVGYIRRRGGAWEETGFEFANDMSVGNSKPSGFHSFGRWVWSSHDEGIPFETMLTLQHECNERVVETTVGPFRVQ